MALITGASTRRNATVVAYAASLVVKAGPGVLYGLTGYNSLGSSQWIQLHDATALPSNGAVPAVILTAATVANFVLDYGVYGRKFDNGILICNSTTGPTLTVGAANCWFDCVYG